MTVSREAALEAPIVSVHAPDVADYDDVVFCPLCGREVQDSVTTPSVPATLFDDPTRLDGQEAHVYAYVCENHRETVVLPMPDIPEPAVRLSARIDGQLRDVGVPAPEVDQ